jgi:hypothetical protein
LWRQVHLRKMTLPRVYLVWPRGTGSIQLRRIRGAPTVTLARKTRQCGPVWALAESIPCRACHLTADRPNNVPHAAPQILEAWRLPPIELAWLGQQSNELCDQLNDPVAGDGTEIGALAKHVRQSPFVAWGFEPGAGRSSPVGSAAILARDIDIWVAAGAPCR